MTTKIPESLQELIECLHIIFSNDKVDVDEVKLVMESYKSNHYDWKDFAFFDQHK